ncbi:sugar ABC transporter ATP-binding protein [Aerococcaceae bacterium DSM 111022]|nr:sugar ABC transporter ATP-binding protein [Aerococcaceae bacterium DSM 111022]
MRVEMKNISKSFGTNEVLKGVDITINGGEIHALMGENGAGKSTLMNILTGLHEQNSGEIVVDGTTVKYDNPKEAEVKGISFIHQEMINWPEMSIKENLFLNKEIKNNFGLVDDKKMYEETQSYLKQLNIKDIDPNELVGNLTVGQQQMVEIVKSLMTDCQILIMDEPTAALSDKEVDVLFKVIRDLKDKGVGIVYISHRMEEVFALCDVITVMRDGLSIDTVNISDTNTDEVVRKMVGRSITDYYPEKTSTIGDTIFEVKNLSAKDGMYENINFSVKAGEIVGFSGLMGAGRSEIMKGIYGLYELESGQIYLEDNELKISTPEKSIKNGIGFLTEDRKTEGLILDFTLTDNVTLPSIDGFSKNGLVDEKTEKEFAQLMIKRLLIRAQSENDIVGQLSGGNQQKVVLAKWIGVGPKVLILDEPTRGVDVGAKREIYQLMNELADRGIAIIVVSSDLPEVLGISDRIIVIHEGKIAGELDKKEANQEDIMTLATGGTLNE